MRRPPPSGSCRPAGTQPGLPCPLHRPSGGGPQGGERGQKMDILDGRQNGDMSHLCLRNIDSKEKGPVSLTADAPDPQTQVVPGFQLSGGMLMGMQIRGWRFSECGSFSSSEPCLNLEMKTLPFPAPAASASASRPAGRPGTETDCLAPVASNERST